VTGIVLFSTLFKHFSPHTLDCSFLFLVVVVVVVVVVVWVVVVVVVMLVLLLLLVLLVHVHRAGNLQSAQFYCERLQADFNVLREQFHKNAEGTCELMYCLLFAMDQRGISTLLPPSLFATANERNTWENQVNAALEQLGHEAPNILDKAIAMTDEELGTTSLQLREVRGMLSNEDMTDEYRCEKVPHLFVHRESTFNPLEELKRQIDTKKWPVVAFVIKHQEKLEALQQVPELVAFIEQVRDKFSGSVKLEDAQSMSLKDCNQRLMAADRDEWEERVSRACSVWNALAAGENQFECEQFVIQELTPQVRRRAEEKKKVANSGPLQ